MKKPLGAASALTSAVEKGRPIQRIANDDTHSASFLRAPRRGKLQVADDHQSLARRNDNRLQEDPYVAAIDNGEAPGLARGGRGDDRAGVDQLCRGLSVNTLHRGLIRLGDRHD
ncbi:MAG: hypothetical protein ACR2PG_08025 [Hyphomicrobiaceae bacterium]